MSNTSTTGRLLIATPAIADGNFEQSVIYMLHHDSDGALGVIINQPSDLAIDELLPRWAELAAQPDVIFSGGPVETNGFIGVGRSLGTATDESSIAQVQGTDLATVDLDGDPAITAALIDRLRIFRGYAGWGAHQLDTELKAGAWFTVDALPQDMWSTAPTKLYEQVLLRQPGEMRWFANAPLDPSQN